MEKWLVVSNCNTTGLTNCLGLLCPQADFTPVHILSFEKEVAEGRLAPEAFSRAFVVPRLAGGRYPSFGRLQNPILVPTLLFSGYHPDVCYVRGPDGEIANAAGDHHSAICFAAHQAGLRPRQAEALYRGATYEAAGYHDVWATDRDNEIERFRQYGIDLAPLFLKWAKSGPFMHTINHPHIGCIFDIARSVLREHGIAHVDSPFRPEDNLRRSLCFPIYPEIAEQCGVTGSLLFKHRSVYRVQTLREFILSCYAVYNRHGRANLHNTFADLERFQRLAQIVG